MNQTFTWEMVGCFTKHLLIDGCLRYQEGVIFYSRFFLPAPRRASSPPSSLYLSILWRLKCRSRRKIPQQAKQKEKQDDIGEETKIAYIDFKWCLSLICLFYIEFDEKEKWFKDASKNQQIIPFIFTFLKHPKKVWKAFRSYLFCWFLVVVLPTTVVVLRENFLKVRGRTQSFQIDKTFCCRGVILQKINLPEKLTQVCASSFVLPFGQLEK